MAQERATRGSAYDAGADRIHLRVDEQKGCRLDGVSIELFKITLKGDPVLCRTLLDLVVCIWKREGGVCVAQKWKCAIIMIFYKNKDREECDNYKGISLEAHASIIVLKANARRLNEYCERVGILPEKQSGFRSNRFTTDMMFVTRRLQELARKKRIS